MKKFLLTFALLVGGIAPFVPLMQAAQEDPEICVPGKPCVFDGCARWDGNDQIYLKIQVYIVGGQYVARFKDDKGNVREAYAIKCGPCKYYINWNDKKYYFEM